MGTQISNTMTFLKEALKKALSLAHLPVHKSPLQPDDILWLHDTTAWASANSKTGYETEFVASFFYKNSSVVASNVVAEITQTLGLTENDEDSELLVEKRVQDFLNTIIVGRTVSVQIDGGGAVALPQSNASGIAATTTGVPFGKPVKNGDIVKWRGITPKGWKGSEVVAEISVAEAEGWGILSDIDDTIKISEVLDTTKLLGHTFLDEHPQPTPNMPTFYKAIKAKLNPAFFYLSASPYNLYPFLHPFLRAHYPWGEPILRDMSWMDVAGLVNSISAGTKGYKVSEGTKVLGTWLPRRKWILIGDSTQQDPESYAELYAKYPDKIKAIWIRRVEGVDLDKEKELNSTTRFEKAFAKVPKEIWTTFTDPGQLGDRLAKLN